jgi:hypothetical protein
MKIRKAERAPRPLLQECIPCAAVPKSAGAIAPIVHCTTRSTNDACKPEDCNGRKKVSAVEEPAAPAMYVARPRIYGETSSNRASRRLHPQRQRRHGRAQARSCSNATPSERWQETCSMVDVDPYRDPHGTGRAG